jgi:hypothetical protein
MNDLLLNFIAQSNECSLTRSGKVFLIPFWEISYRDSRLKIQALAPVQGEEFGQ